MDNHNKQEPIFDFEFQPMILNNEEENLIQAHHRRIANAFNEVTGSELTLDDIELIKQLDVSITRYHEKKRQKFFNNEVPEAILNASK